MPTKNPVGRPKKYIVTDSGRTLTRRRVSQYCISCGGEFTYLYPGTGPYRSLCNTCNPAAEMKPYSH